MPIHPIAEPASTTTSITSAVYGAWGTLFSVEPITVTDTTPTEIIAAPDEGSRIELISVFVNCSLAPAIGAQVSLLADASPLRTYEVARGASMEIASIRPDAAILVLPEGAAFFANTSSSAVTVTVECVYRIVKI